ncbi:hypothetical protein [Flavobacterium pallidum]|uniref:Sulfatase N-terminal domain-containing protein n=1 Tax=Flavobacterium pallidum TaxID=2172098 RepID=A0A2S1SKV8_9FLAO|nr:hypothetical protein [Flavobacterium pallidum]AWI27019.1 hypothetical protein HYN49_14510 [Flavobacterium pallidum]
MGFGKSIKEFVNSDKDYPVLTGFLAGFYPLLFFYDANYESINSIQHLAFFAGLFLILPSLSVYAAYKLVSRFSKTKPYKRHLLFILVIEIAAAFLSQVQYLTLKKKILLALLIVLVLLSKKLHDHYKKVLVFMMLLCIFPAVNVVNTFLSKQFVDTKAWMRQPDHVKNVKFVQKPNVYFIEPDGYTGSDAMADVPYKYHDTMYDYLKLQSFTVYEKTISNYPASLASNASMLGMKHHYLGKILSSPFEMQDARNIISADNPVVEIFRKNDYKTFFIVEDEYFQKNFSRGQYDYYNIQNSEIPFFSDDNSVKKDVYRDLEKCIAAERNSAQPKFYFVEKLLPHHIAFDGSGVANERKSYLDDIETCNKWLKKTISMIGKNDPNAIILIVGDHGGWVGIENNRQMFSTKDPKLLRSIFSNLIAIKWHDKAHVKYDAKLRSNVNIFRVLFACLGQDATLLQNLQPDEAYHIRQHSFSKKPEKVLER